MNETTKVRVLRSPRPGVHVGQHLRLPLIEALALVAAGDADWWPGYEPAEDSGDEGGGTPRADHAAAADDDDGSDDGGGRADVD